METGGVPAADVWRGCDRRARLHREERMLEARGDQPGDLAVATHCSPLADNERRNSNGTGTGNGATDSTNATGSAASKSYSPEHRIRRVSTADRRHLAARRSYRGLSGCRGSVFAAAECVDQKIEDSMPRAERPVPVSLDGACGPLAHRQPVPGFTRELPRSSDDRGQLPETFGTIDSPPSS